MPPTALAATTEDAASWLTGELNLPSTTKPRLRFSAVGSIEQRAWVLDDLVRQDRKCSIEGQSSVKRKAGVLPVVEFSGRLENPTFTLDNKWGPAFCIWNSFNFRNGLDVFSRFPLIFKVFDMRSMQKFKKKSEKFKIFFSRIFGTSYNHSKTILRWSGRVLFLRSVNYFFRGILAPLKII